MLKKYLLLGATVALYASVSAEYLSPDGALERAFSLQNSRRLAAHFSTQATPDFAGEIKTAQGNPALYIFNKPGGGSLLLSASDKATPVLGYTDSGSLDVGNLPPQLASWLNEYADQIEWAEEQAHTIHTSEATFVYPSEWKYIAPLMKTKWDQGAPYNQDVYPYATGCVATAMAQIMKYHEWPPIGHGEHSYTDAYGRTMYMDFGAQPFEWDEMLDSYKGGYTPEQASAVAYLMKACGYSTDMLYSGSSGTQVELAGVALTTYFDYDGSLEVLQRHQYTHTEWATILYEQLKTVGPVLYTGQSLGYMAHAFVADGYDGDGFFHINWGWSGMADGYYSLDALIPSTQGTGGSSYGGYNFTQGMIVNIMKEQTGSEFEKNAELTLLGNISGKMESADGSVIVLTASEASPGNICNNSLVAIEPTFGIRVEGESGSAVYTPMSGCFFGGQVIDDLRFGPGSYIPPQFSMTAPFDMPEGRYKVTVVWRESTVADSQWQDFIMANGCHDYVYVTRTADGFEVEDVPMDRFVIDSAELLTPLYMRNPCEIQFTLTNPTDVELTQSIIPVLLYGDDRKLSFEGDSRLFTVGPNETVTVTGTYTLTGISGGTSPTASKPREYTLGAYDYSLLLGLYYQSGYFGEAYYGDLGTVTMSRPGNNASLKLVEVSIDNAVEKTQEGELVIFGVDDFSDIELSVTVEGVSTYLAAPISAIVTEFGSDAVNSVYERNFEGLVCVQPDETATATTTIQMPQYDPSVIYQIDLFYVQQNTRQQLGSVLFAASSGVESTVAEAAGRPVIFDLTGKPVGSDADALERGIYIMLTPTADGRVTSRKIFKN